MVAVPTQRRTMAEGDGVCPHEAVAVAERIRHIIAATPFACGDETFQVTLTFGISCWNDPHTTIDYCVDCSDQALYAGKAGGRNRVVVLPAQTLCL